MPRRPRYSSLNLEPFDSQVQPPKFPQNNRPPVTQRVPDNSPIPPVDSPEFMAQFKSLIAEVEAIEGRPILETEIETEAELEPETPSAEEEAVQAQAPEEEPQEAEDPTPARKPARRRRKTRRKPVGASSTRLARLEREKPPDLDRHARKCKVCTHPQREMIEEAFVNWHSVNDIVNTFDLDDEYSIYRHCHAQNLFERRRRNIRAVLEHLMENASCITPSGDSIIRAVRAYAAITGYVKWSDPPTTHVVLAGLPADAAVKSPRTPAT